MAANFKDKMKGKTTIGNRVLNSDEALNLSFKNSDKTLSTVKIETLTANPFQPRRTMDETELNELMESIKETGLLQPILITSIDNNPNKFYIVAGHRRVEAHKLLERKEIDAIIYKIDETELKTYSIIENIQREDLSIIDEAFAIKALVDASIKQVDVCKKLGKSKAAISQLVKIAHLDHDLIEYLNNSKHDLGSSILYELTNITTSKQLEAFKHIEKKSLNRDSIREYIKALDGVQKVSPAKLFNGFSISQNKNKISFKLDLDKLEDRSEAIIRLEKLLEDLKNV